MKNDYKKLVKTRKFTESRVISVHDLELILDTLRKMGFRVQLVDDKYRVIFVTSNRDDLLVQENLYCYQFLFGKDQRCTFCLRRSQLVAGESYKYDVLKSDASIVKIHVTTYSVKTKSGSIITVYLHALTSATEEAFEKFQNRLFYSFFGHKQANVIQHLFFWKEFIQMDQVRPLIPLPQLNYLEKTLRTLDVLSSLTRHRPHYQAAVQEYESGHGAMKLGELVRKIKEDIELLIMFPNQVLEIEMEELVEHLRVTRLLRGLLFSIIYDWQGAWGHRVVHAFKFMFSQDGGALSSLNVIIRVIHPKIMRDEVEERMLHQHPIQDINQMHFLGTQLSKFLIMEMGGSLEVQFETPPRNETIIKISLPLQ